jgi:dihydropteroate synthase
MAARLETEFHFADRCWRLGRRTLLAGIVNVTPDSFSDGGAFLDPAAAVAHGERLAAEGADVLDIGGESTRPGAPPVAAAEEERRVVPVIRALARRVQVPLSVDTSKAAVAAAALAAGACIVNDVSGLQRDPEMLGLLGATGAGCILMHMRGTPATMQQCTDYADLGADVCAFFQGTLARAAAAGVPPERFILDPGIGFSKTAEQNLELIRLLPRFRALGRPVLMGPSRKSFIGRLLPGNPPPEGRVWGTAAAVTACALFGADVVRVHDVAAMAQVLAVADAIRAA